MYNSNVKDKPYVKLQPNKKRILDYLYCIKG